MAPAKTSDQNVMTTLPLHPFDSVARRSRVGAASRAHALWWWILEVRCPRCRARIGDSSARRTCARCERRLASRASIFLTVRR